MTIVPHDQLDPQTLNALLEDFITRDGAVHGHRQTTVAQQSAELMTQLNRGVIVIVFDEADESWTIVPKDQVRI